MKLLRDQAKLSKMTDADCGYVEASPAERVDFVWELTKELWSSRDRQSAERRLQRNVANLVRQHKDNLIKNKLSTGRDKDKLDVDYLQSDHST